MNSFEDIYVEKYRPKTLNDIALQPQHREFFEHVKETKNISHTLLVGSPGIGKTSLSKIIVNDLLDCQYLYINASDENGIDTIRHKVIGFAQTRSFDGKLKIVLLDEADAISNEGQKALRNVVEEYAATTRFILTCNYQYKLIDPLQSRFQIFDITPPLPCIVDRVVTVLRGENITVDKEQKIKLIEYIKNYYPDLRRIINDIQKFSYSGKLNISLDSVNSIAKRLLDKILKKETATNLRKFIIENEAHFSGNYLTLLRQLFEEVFTLQINEQIKSNMLKCISEKMFRDSFVVDKEINCFTVCLELLEILT